MQTKHFWSPQYSFAILWEVFSKDLFLGKSWGGKKFFSTHLQMQERIVELATQAVVGPFRAVYKTARKNGKNAMASSAPSALHSFNVFLLVMILHKVIFSLACVLHFVSFRVVRSTMLQKPSKCEVMAWLCTATQILGKIIFWWIQTVHKCHFWQF